MFQFLQNRAFGNAWTGKALTSDLSFLLTKFKNYVNDEYSTSDNDGMSVPPMACSFAKCFRNGHIVSVVDEDGYIVMYDTNMTGAAAVKSTWQAHANAVFDLMWAEDDTQILTASGDQTVALWDVETHRKMEVFKGHTSSVKSVSLRFEDEAVFASGSRDGHVMIWDKRIFHKEGTTIPPVDTIYNAHALQQNSTPGKPRKKKIQPKDGQQSVTSVVFQDKNLLVSCGAADGCIKVWDIRKTHKLFTAGPVPVQVFNYPGSSLRKHGFSCLTMDDTRSRLFVSCTDDIIYEYNMKSQDGLPVNGYRGHKNTTFYVKSVLSPDNRFLLSGSSDNHAYIWQVNKPSAPPVLLKAHDAEVTGVAWCPVDLTKIVTLSDDAKTKFWRIYCREQKKGSLPPWLGRARRFSKERSTSMSQTPVLNKQMQNVNTPSPSQSPVPSPKTHQTATPTSLRDWLKRKHQKEASIAEEALRSKTSQTTQCSSSTGSERLTSIPAKRSHSDIASCSRDEPSPEIRTECATHSKKIKLDTDSPATPSSKPSPGTPKRCKNNENHVRYTSPRKLFKRDSDSQDSPTKSPKRQCLTPVQGNVERNDFADRAACVRTSLFEDCSTNKNSCSNDTQFIASNDKVRNDLSSKLSLNLEDTISPSKQAFSCISGEESQDSPTRNLPNLVMDQLTNLRPTSPSLTKSAKPKKLDWLTRLKQDKGMKRSESKDKGASNSQLPGPSSAKLSPKVSKSSKMKTIHSYFKAQSDN